MSEQKLDGTLHSAPGNNIEDPKNWKNRTFLIRHTSDVNYDMDYVDTLSDDPLRQMDPEIQLNAIESDLSSSWNRTGVRNIKTWRHDLQQFPLGDVGKGGLEKARAEAVNFFKKYNFPKHQPIIIYSSWELRALQTANEYAKVGREMELNIVMHDDTGTDIAKRVAGGYVASSKELSQDNPRWLMVLFNPVNRRTGNALDEADAKELLALEKGYEEEYKNKSVELELSGAPADVKAEILRAIQIEIDKIKVRVPRVIKNIPDLEEKWLRKNVKGMTPEKFAEIYNMWVKMREYITLHDMGNWGDNFHTHADYVRNHFQKLISGDIYGRDIYEIQMKKFLDKVTLADITAKTPSIKLAFVHEDSLGKKTKPGTKRESIPPLSGYEVSREKDGEIKFERI